MRTRTGILVAVLWIISTACCVDGSSYDIIADDDSQGRLLLILIDGVRWDQVLDPDLHGFNEIIRTGVRADHMQPVFPANSYVNYYAIATGLWPESNGVLDNYMYDGENDATFWIGERSSDFDSFWWEEGDPIWITATRQNLMSHVHYWPGCEALIRGLTPTYCRPYEPGLTVEDFSDAIGSALESLNRGHIQFASVYTSVIDYASHKNGPDSQETKSILRQLDTVMTEMMERLRSEITPEGEALRDLVDVIIVSDHGMASARTDDVVRLHEYVNHTTLERCLCRTTTTVCHLWPKHGQLDNVYNALKRAAHSKVYKRTDMPERYHYKGHRRAAPIIVIADVGWTLGSVEVPSGPQRGILGNHGYDNQEADMGAVFLATGPSFQSGQVHDAISAVDVYQLMCHILDLHPSPNNGTWSHVADMLAGNSALPVSLSYYALVITALVIISISG